MGSILNICGYRFVHLDKPAQWRESLRARAEADALKGTILLAAEGINLVLAGAERSVRDFVAWLRAQEPFIDLETRESRSETLPFRHLLVKVKREIIRMNRPAIRPQVGRAPSVDAATLAHWLDAGGDDAGRQLVLLDTRNAFEVDLGRFRGARDWRIARFGDFPRALGEHRADLDGKTVVSYCTGGIRCEKAALLMADAGVANVLQLEGGILKYFETVGGRHFEGHCFVFDARQALDDTLGPAHAV